MLRMHKGRGMLPAVVAFLVTGAASGAINSRSYVPGGLVAQYDGINNVGHDAAHSDAAATWVDLTGNGNDAAKAANVTWAANGWVNAADCKPMVVTSRGIAAVTATKTFTMEFATTPSRYTERQCFFGQYDKRGFSVEHNSSSGNSKNGFLRLYYYLNSVSALNDEFIYTTQANEWATVSIASDVARQTLRKNGGVVNTMDKSIGGTMTDDCDSVIGGDNSRNDMAFRGTYHAFRLYDRVLTDREAAINAAVDAVRFNGADWSAYPELAAYSFDASGNLQKSLLAVAEEGGSVKIGDGTAAASAATEPVAFSAAGEQTATFTAVPAAGYVLYRWEGDTGAIKDGSVVSPSVTVASSEGTRLVAVFRKRGLTAQSYVQDGLVALYDGIENAGVGQHSDNATTWVDLTGNGNDGACATELSWSDNGWSVSGNCKPVTVASTQLSKTLSTGVFSIQFACTPGTPRSSDGRMCYFGQFSGVAGDVNVEKTAANEVRLYRNTMLGVTYDWKSSGKTYMPAGSFASIAYAMSVNAGSLYVGGDAKETKTANFITSRTNTTSIIGGEVSRPQYAFSGTYNAFRLYNRVLTAEENAWNAMVDDARFNNGANLPAGYSTDGEGALLVMVSATATAGGKVSIRGGSAVSSVSANVDKFGSDYTYLEAFPEEGYVFDRWTGDTDAITEGHAASARIAVDPSKPLSLTAVFRRHGNALDGMILDLDIRGVEDGQLMYANLRNVGDALKAGSSTSNTAYTCWYSQPSGFADYIPKFRLMDIASPMTPFTTNAAQPCIYLTQKVNENGVCGVSRWELPYDYVPPPVATIYTRFLWEGCVTNGVANDCCILCNGYDSYNTPNQGFVLRIRTSTNGDKGYFNVFMPGTVPSVDTSGDYITPGSWVDCFVSVYPSPTDERRSNADIWFCQTPSQASSGIFNQPQLKHKHMGDECGLPRFNKVANGHAMRLGAEASGATDDVETKRKSFRGYYAALKAWNRVLTENEMFSVMSGRYGTTFSVGVANGSADEFGGSWYGTADPFDVDADKWQAMKKSLTAADRTLTLTVAIPEESSGLLRVLEIVPLFDGVGASCPVTVTANGIDVGTFDLVDEAQRAVVLRGGHARNGASGKLTIAIVRPEGCEGTLSFDSLSLAGSWQIGADNDTSTDMTQQAQGVTSVFIAGDPIYKHAQRGLTTTYNTLVIPFDVPKSSVGQCAYRYEADLHDFKAGNTHPLHLEFNGETVWSSEDATKGKVRVELAAESIRSGLNELKWVYDTTTANNWMTFDYHMMKMLAPIGTLIIIQ